MSQKYKICLIAGTRPEVIKLAPVYFALKQSRILTPIWLSTGQHRHLLDQAMSAFGIYADDDLDLMLPSQSLESLTAKIILGVGEFLSKVNPDAVVLQGDTSTVLASGLAAFFKKIPIAHVEAGLRTYDMESPWPEEMNRRLLAPLCRWCFSPTKAAKDNLVQERIEAERCIITGNTVIDSLLHIRNRVVDSNEDVKVFSNRIGVNPNFYENHIQNLESKIILLTLHRRESFGGGLREICLAIKELIRIHPKVCVICPMHLNPSARDPIREILGKEPRVSLIEPIEYPDFVRLMEISRFIISDSGGVQEEAPSLERPVLVVRSETERMEGVHAGTARLVGTSQTLIVDEALLLLVDECEYEMRKSIPNPYGDGKAASRIVSVLEKYFSDRNNSS